MNRSQMLSIRACASQGYTVEEIAERYQLTVSEVAAYIKTLGYRVRYQKPHHTVPDPEPKTGRLTPSEKVRIWELSDCGFSPEAISKITGRTVRTVLRLLSRDANRITKEEKPCTQNTES